MSSKAAKPALVIAILATAVLTIVPAVIDGQRTFRWGTNDEAIELARRLEDFPEQIGDWEMLSSTSLDRASINELRPLAYFNRTYFNRLTGQHAQVFVLLGPTGPTSVHTPEVCIDSRDYQIEGGTQQVVLSGIDSTSVEAVQSSFHSRDAGSTWLRSWHAWTSDGTWHTPAQARFFFAGKAWLFKIQVVMLYYDRQEMQNDQNGKELVVAVQRELARRVF